MRGDKNYVKFLCDSMGPQTIVVVFMTSLLHGWASGGKIPLT